MGFVQSGWEINSSGHEVETTTENLFHQKYNLGIYTTQFINVYGVGIEFFFYLFYYVRKVL